MDKSKKQPVEKHFNDYYNASKNTILINSVSSSLGPIWEVDNYIGKERYFIHGFFEKGLTDELESRVNTTLIDSKHLKHKILLEIKEDTEETALNLLSVSFRKVYHFQLEIEEFAKVNNVQLNDEYTNAEIIEFYNSIDNKFGRKNPIFNSELSRAAIQIRDEVENSVIKKNSISVPVLALKTYLENRIIGKDRFDKPIKKNTSDFGVKLGVSGNSFYNWYSAIANSQDATGNENYKILPDHIETLKDVLLREDKNKFEHLQNYLKNAWKDQKQ